MGHYYRPTGQPSFLGGDGAFPCPFDDVASLRMPETLPLAMRWLEFLVLSDGTYFQALNRVASYFLTDVEIDGISDDEAEKWGRYLDDVLGVRNCLHTAILDAMVYGNAFVSVLPGFKRHLYCPSCRSVELPLARFYCDASLEFRWADFKFHARCPRCGHHGVFRHVDRKSGEKEACVFKRWNVHDMEILWDPFTDRTEYVWKIPEDYCRLIRDGKKIALENAPWEVVECVAARKHLLFEPGVVHHVREDALAGLRNRGWGISRVLSNFRQSWYVQVLRRYNEAIALDYVVPWRIVTPESGDRAAGADLLQSQNAGSFVSQVRRMIRRWRRDPAEVQIMPLPIKYQMLGGEARNLAPVDLIKQGVEVQLANIGVPADLWYGSLQTQAAPVALRLFESSWSSLPHGYNTLLRFLVSSVARILGWDEPRVRLQPVTHADDVLAQQAKLQLMMGGQVSPSTGLKALRLKYRDEVKRIIEDQRYQAEQQAKAQEEMDAQAQMEEMTSQPQGAAMGQQPGAAGAAPQPGQPAQGQPGPMGQAAGSIAASLVVGDGEKVSPQELWERADVAAQQLLGMDAGQRASELRHIKKINPNIHPYVLELIEQKRRAARQQGGASVLQQTFGGSH